MWHRLYANIQLPDQDFAGTTSNIHTICIHLGLVQVQTQNTRFREGISLTCDGSFCQGALLTACAVLLRHRNCRIHHHKQQQWTEWLAVYRLILLLQVMGRFLEQVSKKTGTSVRPTKSSSVGIIVKKYWNALLHLSTMLDQINSEVLKALSAPLLSSSWPPPRPSLSSSS